MENLPNKNYQATTMHCAQYSIQHARALGTGYHASLRYTPAIWVRDVLVSTTWPTWYAICLLCKPEHVACANRSC